VTPTAADLRRLSSAAWLCSRARLTASHGLDRAQDPWKPGPTRVCPPRWPEDTSVTKRDADGGYAR